MSTTTVNQIRAGFYLDSVALMRISAKISALPGVREAALMIGSQSNKHILQTAGLLAGKGRSAGPNDLIIGIRADSVEAADKALAHATAALDRSASGSSAAAGRWRPKSLDAAAEALPGANLALISVPGEFAAREAYKALRRGLNVLLFSDNVSLEQELALKQEARKRNLLVMGPDCGTVLFNGVPLAFANAIPRGRIGAIAASGTGLQEFSVLIARAGQGLSHGIGVGGRDLNDDIGGLSTFTALDLLEQDRATERIVLLSKPPGVNTAARLLHRLGQCRKPVVVCFLGLEGHSRAPVNVSFAPTLRAAAEQALGHTIGAGFRTAARVKLAEHRRWLRGLFSGGTLCAEAQVLLRQAGLRFASNVPIPDGDSLGASTSLHTVIDLGADEYTVGRPHPMIEPSARTDALARALAEPAAAVVLLDVVLGYGAHPDPAGAIAHTVASAQNPRPLVVASVCGVPGDPQDYAQQVHKLEAAGVLVAPSNAHACELAIQVVKHRAV